MSAPALSAVTSELLAALIDVLPYAEAAIGLPRDRWPHDSVILRAEAAIARATANPAPTTMDYPADWYIAAGAPVADTTDRIDIPAFYRNLGLHEEKS